MVPILDNCIFVCMGVIECGSIANLKVWHHFSKDCHDFCILRNRVNFADLP